MSVDTRATAPPGTVEAGASGSQPTAPPGAAEAAGTAPPTAAEAAGAIEGKTGTINGGLGRSDMGMAGISGWKLRCQRPALSQRVAVHFMWFALSDRGWIASKPEWTALLEDSMVPRLFSFP